MALSKSASDPGLRSSGSLRVAGTGSLLGNATTNLYDSMKAQGLVREHFASIRPSGRSIVLPTADSAGRNLQPEIHYPLPETPIGERRFRRTSHNPGEITVHHGLKEQRLPGEGFRYGKRGIQGATAEGCLKAGQLLGVAEYRNRVAEAVYESNKREPLGRPVNRGHEIKMRPEGFGIPSAKPQGAKVAIFPVDQGQTTEEARCQYRTTHGNYQPGERIERNYSMPAVTKDDAFRFGAVEPRPANGAGVALALNTSVEDDGTCRKTRLVQRTAEDYRQVQHPKHFQKSHAKQGPSGPPMPGDHQYGIKSGVNDYTAESCIKGYYSLEEQLPDQDLGRSTKPGRRNVTTETRAFGVPSVRSDILAPTDARRSLADAQSYGDEPSAAALLCPQRFESQGVPDREFLVRRPKDELRELLEHSKLEGVDFEDLWDRGLQLFDDGLPLVSLDALLYLQSGIIEERVGRAISFGEASALPVR
mmetsp:Transcript_128483/g.256665  ORF Transcript_128483/g.256665 Transcript_128483/m.256665 type:complete len:476 (+) Transcript_128483:101-1528(+)